MSKFKALRLGAAAVALAGAVFAPLAPAAADALADTEKAKVIKIAVSQVFAPFRSARLSPRATTSTWRTPSASRWA